jgi:hypothetical protein
MAGTRIGKIKRINMTSLNGILKNVRPYPANVETIIENIIVPTDTITLLVKASSIPIVCVTLPVVLCIFFDELLVAVVALVRAAVS